MTDHTAVLRDLPLNWDPIFEWTDEIIADPTGPTAARYRVEQVRFNRYIPVDIPLTWKRNVSNNKETVYATTNCIALKHVQYGAAWIMVMESCSPDDPEERSVTIALYIAATPDSLYVLAEFPLYVIHEDYFADALFINYGFN